MNEYIVPIIADKIIAYLKVEAKTTKSAERKAQHVFQLLASGHAEVRMNEIERM